MASPLECTQCGFDLARLPVSVRVEPADGATKLLTCPLCGDALPIKLESIGVLVLGAGAATTFTRWKLAAKDDTGTSIKSERKDGGTGRLTFRFEALNYMAPQDVLYPKIPAFLDAENGVLKFPALPVKPEFFQCIDQVKARRLAQQPGGIGMLVGPVYQFALPLKGLTPAQERELQKITRPVHTPEPGPPSKENAFGDINVRIWPKIRVPSWKYYLVGVAGSGERGGKLVAEKFVRATVRTESADDWKAVDNVQANGAARATSLRERPTWVAVELGEEGRAVSGGLFLVPALQDTLEAVPATAFGLDFGTSNTCVAIEGSMATGRSSDPELLPIVKETQWNEYLVRGGPELTVPTGPDLWPPALGFGRKKDLFASELVFEKPRREMVAQLAKIDQWDFGIHFGVPAADVTPKFDESLHTLGEIKWSAMLQRREPLYAPKVQQLQAHYITSVLMMAYVRAAAVSTNAAPTANVIYSHPMSFGHELEHLTESMKIVQERLTDLTGIDWNISAGVDESAAAAKNAGDTHSDVLVYVDMGGGSTDIAVKVALPNDKWSVVYLTSVIYGGTAIVNGYAGESRSGKGSSCLAGKTTTDMLRRRIRESTSTKAVLSDPTLFKHESVVKRRTAHFYGYIIEYIARILAAGILDQRFKTFEGGVWKFKEELKFDFFFLGNGWGFYGLTANEPEQALASAIYVRMRELVKGEKSDYAKAVKRGMTIAEAPVTPKLHGMPHPKAAVAVGVLKAEKDKKLQSSTAEDLRSGIVGWPTTADGKEIPWYAYYSRRGKGGPAIPPCCVKAKSGGLSMDDDDEPAVAVAADGAPTPDYYSPLATNPRLNWEPGAAPSLPVHLTPISDPASPEDSLDPDLNATRGSLKSECSPNDAGWFAKGPYEVLLEKLFAEKLGEIGA